MHFNVFPFLVLIAITTALHAQEFRYKLNKQPFYAESKEGIQLIHHDSTGYIIYIPGAPVPGKSLNKLCKLDPKYSITDSIILPNLKQNRVQQFFKTSQGIGWFYDYYNSDSSCRYYEVTQLTFGKEKLKKVVLGKIENWQSGLPKVVGYNLGFSSDQKMIYFYLWKEKSRSEKIWISQVSVFNPDLLILNTFPLDENTAHGPFWGENAILRSDTTFCWVYPQKSKTSGQSNFVLQPDTIKELILHCWHLPSNTKSEYSESSINQGIHNPRLIFDNAGKLHYVGFYTLAKKYYAKGFFDYLVTDKNELKLLSKHFFAPGELKEIKAKNFDPIRDAGNECGLDDDYEFQKIYADPDGMYDYFIVELKIKVNSGAGAVPAGGSFLIGALSGVTSAYLHSYAIENPEFQFNPVLIVQKSIADNSCTSLVFPTAQESKNLNLVGVYQFEYKGNKFMISNESRKNAKKKIEEWDWFSRFTNMGQACITSLTSQKKFIQFNAFPSIDSNPAIIVISQIARLNEKEFLIIAKPNATSQEHYFGKLMVSD